MAIERIDYGLTDHVRKAQNGTKITKFKYSYCGKDKVTYRNAFNQPFLYNVGEY